MAWLYENRSSDNAVLKRDDGFPTQDAAKIAGREDARKMKNYASAGQAGCWAHHGRAECGKGNTVLIQFLAVEQTAPMMSRSQNFSAEHRYYFGALTV